MGRGWGGGRGGAVQDVPVAAVVEEVRISSVAPPNLTPPQTYQAAADLWARQTPDDPVADLVVTGRPVTWSSSNGAVFTVSAGGLVTAAGAGTATLTVSAEGTSTTQTIVVTVPQSPPLSVGISPAGPLDLAVGQSQVLVALVYDGAGQTGNVLTGQTVNWTTSNGVNVSVTDNGGDPSHQATITALVTSTGTTITATVP